jgi:hypothetical protein
MSETAVAEPRIKKKRPYVGKLTKAQQDAARRANAQKAGRPKGAVTIKTRRRINELTAEKETPVDVMFDNMLYWHRKVQELGPEFEEMLATSTETMRRIKKAVDEDLPLGGDDYREAASLVRATNELAGRFLYARERSQSCAVDAAPYCHPRLQAIAIQSKNTHEFKITGGLPDMPVGEGETPVMDAK